MNLAYTPPSLAPPQPGRSGDRYLVGLGLALLGYALLARGFAYWGVPPIYVGEIFLAVGLVQLIRAATLSRLAVLPAVWLLVGLIGLTIVRTQPYVAEYGIDAGRDAMQILYGLYALIVAALLVERRERLGDLIRKYRSFVVVMVSLVWLVYLGFKLAETSIPYLPWAVGSARMFEAKGGDLMVHLAAITVFLMVGLMRRQPVLVGALVFTTGIIAVSNRGGMVAFAVAVLAGYLLRPPEARVGKMVYAFALLLVVGLIVGPVVQIHDGSREISVEQLKENIESVFGQSDSSSLEGTKRWRLDWWEKIYGYTVHGEYFWTGKGFGVNLARSDGFVVDPSLRSPHNGHLTILARAGVPGALLWILLQLAWFGSVVGAWWRAREESQSRWMACFATIVAYWVAMHINAAFDVYFEGPMGGIWFWSVFGVGLGAAWIHRHHPDALPDPESTSSQNDGGEAQSFAPDAPARPPERVHPWGWPAPARPPGP